jgi:hypothetical protein
MFPNISYIGPYNWLQKYSVVVAYLRNRHDCQERTDGANPREDMKTMHSQDKTMAGSTVGRTSLASLLDPRKHLHTEKSKYYHQIESTYKVTLSREVIVGFTGG